MGIGGLNEGYHNSQYMSIFGIEYVISVAVLLSGVVVLKVPIGKGKVGGSSKGVLRSPTECCICISISIQSIYIYKVGI